MLLKLCIGTVDCVATVLEDFGNIYAAKLVSVGRIVSVFHHKSANSRPPRLGSSSFAVASRTGDVAC